MQTGSMRRVRLLSCQPGAQLVPMLRGRIGFHGSHVSSRLPLDARETATGGALHVSALDGMPPHFLGHAIAKSGYAHLACGASAGLSNGRGMGEVWERRHTRGEIAKSGVLV